MVNEELDTDSDDEMDLEIERETASEELSTKSQKVRVKQVVRVLMMERSDNGQQETQGIHIY
jgi:hypothetical protein